MPEPTWDCDKCGAPNAIHREREQTCIPTAEGLITRTRHIDGAWCQTFTPRKVNP